MGGEKKTKEKPKEVMKEDRKEKKMRKEDRRAAVLETREEADDDRGRPVQREDKREKNKSKDKHMREQDGTPYKAPVRNAVYTSDPVIQAPETRSPSKQRSPSRQYDRVVQKGPIRRRSRSVSPQQGPGVGRGKGVQVHEERSASRSPSYKRDEKRREEVQPHHDVPKK